MSHLPFPDFKKVRFAFAGFKGGMYSSPEIHGFLPRTTPTAKKWDSRGDIFAMAKMGRVSGFWRFTGKYLGTGQKIPYWEPTGEISWISGPEYRPPSKKGVVDGLAPGLKSIRPGSFPEAPIG